MRWAPCWGLVGWLLAVPAAHAADSLRVGNRVLVAGDSAAAVTALLGKPSYKSHARASSTRSRKRRSAPTAATGSAERWQYQRDGRVVVVTLIDGRVADIDERTR